MVTKVEWKRNKEYNEWSNIVRRDFAERFPRAFSSDNSMKRQLMWRDIHDIRKMRKNHASFAQIAQKHDIPIKSAQGICKGEIWREE